MRKSRRRIRLRLAGLGAAAIIAAAGGIVFARAGEPTGMSDRNWRKDVQAVARLLIEQYGLPDMAGPDALVWFNNGPWRRTVLHRTGFTRPLIGKERDHLEQAVTYRVPEKMVAAVRRFDKRIEVNRTTGELISRADAESMNYLALNLADDIVKGERTAREARAFYEKVKKLEMTGKSSPYLDGLMFAVQNVKTKEPEKTGEPQKEIPEKVRREMSYPPDYFDVPAR